MKTIYIDQSGSLSHYRLFIIFKNIAQGSSATLFLKQYMEFLLAETEKKLVDDFSKLKYKVFGEPDKLDFYPKWLYNQYVKKYGTLQKDIPVIEVKKDFNYYYREGFISFGKTELVGDEHPSFIGGYKAAKSIFLNKKNSV